MIIEPNANPIDVYAGVYKHYKGELYLVEGYSQDASSSNKLQIAYSPLYTDKDKPGARKITRDWKEFFETVCVFHDGVPVYTEEHTDARRDDEMFKTCDPEKDWVDRFVYKGPVYYRGFES